MISVLVLRTSIPKKGIKIVGSLRHYRKPRWVPMAKSKMYKNVELRVLPTIEEQELQRLKRDSKLYHKSLWMFQKQIYEAQVIREQQEAKQISEDVELEKIFAKNDEDNAKVKAFRESQLQVEWKQIEEKILMEKSLIETKVLQSIESSEKVLNAEMERLKNVITEDKLDEAIQKALSVVTDYNFAINKDGQIFRGRKNHETAEGLDKIHEPLRLDNSSLPTQKTL